jgi:hypothetical protein
VGLPCDLLVRGFQLNIFLTVLVSGILCTHWFYSKFKMWCNSLFKIIFALKFYSSSAWKPGPRNSIILTYCDLVIKYINIYF